MNWQPIETAEIKSFDQENWFMSHSDNLLLWVGYPTIGAYEFTQKGKGRWKANGYNINPSHWMGLPGKPL